MDFTLNTYKNLLAAISRAEYKFQTVEEFVQTPFKRAVVLRHDVDRLPENSFKTAVVEHELGIKTTYYFRTPSKYSPADIIKKIVTLGHEIGYHYEDLTTSAGDYEKAIASFQTCLEYFRQFYPVKTICMHGNPTGQWDNRGIWKKYDYRDFGIIAEPYLDVDYNKVLYLTDTGRRWNGGQVSVRDKVNSKYDFNLRTTGQVISAILAQKLPEKILITTHPQRWTNDNIEWAKELILQNLKNIIKYFIIRKNSLR